MHFGPERRVHDVSATATAAGGVPGRRWGRVDPVSGRHRGMMETSMDATVCRRCGEIRFTRLEVSFEREGATFCGASGHMDQYDDVMRGGSGH